MLNKTAAHPTLQHDGDLKMFLESESFTVDIKHKERKEPVLAESKGLFSGIGISVGGGGKFVEQDEVGNFNIFLIYTNHCSGSTSAEYILTHWKAN